VLPFFDGPLPIDGERIPGAFYYHFDFGRGVELYRRVFELTHEAQDAIEALLNINWVLLNLAPDGNRDWLIRAALTVGSILERLRVRQYEPLVLSGRLAREKAAKGGKATAVWTDEIAKRARASITEKMKAGVSYDAAVRRTIAELAKEEVAAISTTTVKRHLPRSEFSNA
jgi:hypothetical protein